MNGEVKSLPPALDYILTRKIPCALLALVMFMGMFWAAATVGGGMGMLLVMVLAVAHMMTPALFAVITLGGGLTYTIHVALLSGAAVMVASQFNVLLGLMYVLLYALIPAVAAGVVQRPGGLGKASTQLAIAIGVAVLVGLFVGAQSTDTGLREFTASLLKPYFEAMSSGVPAGDVQAMQTVEQMRDLTVTLFPGLLMFSLWMAWWTNVLIGRHVAVRYGFYRGDRTSWLYTKYSRTLGVVALLTVAVANLTDGNLQFMAFAVAMLLSALLGLQGVAVVHLWLKSRSMDMMVAILYLLLLIWPGMIFPFIILGLLDIWFDFRRNITPAAGG